jgi:dihydroorotase
MRNTGRVRVGADADLVVFDPARIADTATFEKPAAYSIGVRHLLVGGEAVVEDGALRPDVRPGKAIRAAIVGD